MDVQPRSPVVPRSPVTAAEVAATRRPVVEASLLPPRVFHDPAVLDFEQAAWFGRDWVFVARSEDVDRPGRYVQVEVAGQPLVVIRGEDDVVRAFHNVCRHRGALICTEPAGRIVRFQCPYHAWTYELDGRLRRASHTDTLVDFDTADYGLVPARAAEWQGLVFVSLDPDAPDLHETLAGLWRHIDRFPLADLRRAHRIEYDVDANWKVIGENYSECYHCPGVHPQLNKLTPYDLGQNIESDGPWCGGWMELRPDFDTMSVDGLRHGRPPLPGITTEDERRIYYFLVWPNLLLSLHPDYLMTHQVWPVAPGRSKVICEWSFHPDTMATDGFDPSDAVDFWDLTNRQDWEVCELQQRGTASPAYTPGRYALMEDMVHAFDVMLADGYAQDGVDSRFTPRHDKWRQPVGSGGRGR
ncbi:MAG: aromatic ring-hydroxylating dioxygenase subunit alpha [Chloroflexi bacterium]|nr:aromatic ring-hydroxylating dioxygenase subunit alpha [Chloroflexota bacterium]